jgi:hypothetical protein
MPNYICLSAQPSNLTIQCSPSTIFHLPFLLIITNFPFYNNVIIYRFVTMAPTLITNPSDPGIKGLLLDDEEVIDDAID